MSKLLFIVGWKLTIVGSPQPMSFNFPTRVENYQAGFWKDIIPLFQIQIQFQIQLNNLPAILLVQSPIPPESPTLNVYSVSYRISFSTQPGQWPWWILCTLCLFNVNLGFIWVHLVQIVLSKLINIWISNSIAPIVNHTFIQSALHKVLNYIFLLRPDWSNYWCFLFNLKYCSEWSFWVPP